MGDVQISQVLAEVDAQNSAPDIQITQLMAEVDAQNSAPDIQITQLMAEVDVDPYVVSVSQVFVEADIDPVSTLIASQVFVEADIDPVSTLVGSQVFVEVDAEVIDTPTPVDEFTVQIPAVYANDDVATMYTPSTSSYAVYEDARAGDYEVDYDVGDCGTGARFSAGEYRIYRGLVRFDTSSIPGGATITAVKMTVFPSLSGAAVTNARILKYDWSDGPDWSDILDAEVQAGFFYVYATLTDDYYYVAYDSGPLSVTWVDRTGYTYYGLVAQDDLDAVAPNTDSRFFFDSGYSTDVAPYLTVTYTLPVSTTRAMSGMSGMSGQLT